MTVSEFLYKHLSGIADTFPISAPIDTKLPIITYTLDSQEVVKTVSGVAYTENFVTVTVYADEYDKAEVLANSIQDVLKCSSEQNILGATYSGKTNEYDPEPVDRYSVALDFTVYER